MQTWHVAVRFSSVKMAANNVVAVWHVETKAPNWQVNTEFRLLNWSDLVKDDFRRWPFDRILRAVKAFANFMISGTCWRYVRTSWRFGLLFLYPVLAAFLFSVVGLWLAALLANLNVPFALLIGLIFGVGLFAAYVQKWLDPFELPPRRGFMEFFYMILFISNKLAFQSDLGFSAKTSSPNCNLTTTTRSLSSAMALAPRCSRSYWIAYFSRFPNSTSETAAQ